MNEPNSILEFLGILLVMGIVMAIFITLLTEGKEKLSNLHKNNKKTLIDSKDSNYIKSENVNYKGSEKSIPKKTLSEKSFSELDKTKLFINNIFYDFCFDIETAKIFLIDNEVQREIMLGLILFQFEDEKLVEKIMKLFFRKKYGFNLGQGSYNSYVIDGYKFYIDVHREYCTDENSYFEILYNDFKNVVNKNNLEVLIARQFIVFCENNYPKALFVLVYDPFLKKHFVRRIFQDGKSVMIKTIEDAESDELLNYLESYVIKL